jgi:hypothetical protein
MDSESLEARITTSQTRLGLTEFDCRQYADTLNYHVIIVLLHE